VLLFSLGYSTSRLTKINPIKAGLQIALFGIIASVITYSLGAFFATTFGLHPI